MEREIGERFSYNGTTLEVVENSNYNCEKCFFFQRACDKIKCLMTERTDSKNVYFIEVYKKMKILYLPLKAKWYNMIDSGVKPEDYRENKLYWCKRLYKNGDRTTQEFKKYTHVRFSYGYTKRRMTFAIKKIILSFGNPEWGAPSDKLVFIIQLGKRERKVGEIFSYNGKTLKVVESDFCVGCYFIDFCRKFNGKLPAGLCIKESRSDGKSVIFKEVLK